MKTKLTTIICLFLIVSCQQNKEKNAEEKTVSTETKELSLSEKIAEAHGYEQWQNVTEFQFRFGGSEDDANSGRAWKWNPKTNDVVMMTAQDTIAYNRTNLDSLAMKADPAFINDKFWALIPFQLIWDEGLTVSEPVDAEGPVTLQDLKKVTMTYGSEGGYTPGDAYDLYIDDYFVIREWSFRKGNSPEPSLSNTFENYGDYNGIKVAKDHKFGEGDRNLLIRDVKVVLDK